MSVDTATRKGVELDPAGVTGLRLYTRGPVTLPWLSKQVLPVARTLTDVSGRLVYLRHGWLNGPHVDIVARRAFGPAVPWHVLAAELDAGPLDPTTAMSEAHYLAQAATLGRLENVRGPYTPFHQHGVVETLSAEDLVGEHPSLAQLRDVVFGFTNKALMRTIDEVAADPELAVTRLAEAFVALADTHALGITYGALSLRCHAESFLAGMGAQRKVRTTFENRLLAEAPVFREVVAQRIADRPSPTAAAWRTAMAYCGGALDHAAATGFLTAELLDSVTAVSRPAPVPQSPFQRAMAASMLNTEPSPFFAPYRMLINLFYQQLPLLTVSPLQRYYMCHAIAETVDELLGQTWDDRLVAQQWELAAFAH